MHKTVIAFAIAGLAAAPAFADSNVTLYGSIDYGWLMRNGDSGLSGNAARPKQEFASGVSTPNRIGFKGADDLGNGTKVIFELEGGFLADTGTNSIPGPTAGTSAVAVTCSKPVIGTAPKCTGAVNNSTLQAAGQTGGGMFRRHAWVGLTGDWGTVLGGRVDGARYGVWGRYDPFEQGGVGNATSLNGQATRADNAIAYVTPNYEGLYAVLAYTSSLIGQEAAGNNGDTRLWVVQPNYVHGPLSVTLNYEHASAHNSPTNTTIKIYVAAASYDFGVAKLTGVYEHVKTDSDTQCTEGVICDEDSWLVGGVVPVTETDKVRASYVNYKDKSAAADSCAKWGIGGQHFLDKRTNFYVDFASITQKDKGHCTVQPTPTGGSLDAGAGSNQAGVGTRGFDAGIVHRF
ncbi:MAG TPA: porin [Burkholderiaceae bacterium]|jgi:predicted porin|nr:porin [Burkholderiaceae bacterium]